MGYRVLLAEDDDDLRESLASILHSEGFRARSFKTGGQALAALRDQQPDVVLLDLNIRDMDVDEFLRQQAGDPLISMVPVVIITGRAPARVFSSVRSTLRKPFDVGQFLRAVTGAAPG
ncbi:MAG TPA: response regulator [Myxococcales bacterium]|jgi:CheY-like chemotaxis protein|nr:response regulator [Myxococcales bacterium]